MLPRNGGDEPRVVGVVLNVAEKPSVARSLAAAFAQMPGARDQGMRRMAHQVFTCDNVEFPALQSQGRGVEIRNGPNAPHTMITTSVRGHLASQDFDATLYGWSQCPPERLFDAPIQTRYRRDMQPLERMLSQLAQRVDDVILWLDCDREGEAIGAEVRDVCCSSTVRRHQRQQLPVYRARFSTVLPREIHRALRSLGRLNANLVDAVHARMELDLRVGAAFTRFQTTRLQKKFDYHNVGNSNNNTANGNSNNSGGVVSYGPCQFPTLGFVVERWARRETFVAEDYWHLELALRVDGDQSNNSNGNNNDNNNDSNNNNNSPQPMEIEGQRQPNNSNNHSSNNSSSSAPGRSIQFQWKRGRLYDAALAQYLYESCLESPEAVVTELRGRPKNKWRPVPLATVELQKRAARFLRLGSEQLMAAAEELYQQGCISYPRTETERFRPEFQHRPLIEQLAALPLDSDLGGYARQLLLNNNFQNPRAGPHDDQAHPPITPCKAVDPATIGNSAQRDVYTLVVKHYLACCSRDAVGKETTLTVQLGETCEEFTARGLMVLERNWLEIYHPWERWSTGQGELPPLQVGSRVRPSSLLLKQGRTAPPAPLSEVELITLMDRNGIGTDATIAQHIATIQDRAYAAKDARTMKFWPTELGIALVEAYNSMGYQLNKPDLRRETESECSAVAAGQKTKHAAVAALLDKMRQIFRSVLQEADKLDAAVARRFPRLGASSNNATSETVQAQFSACGACGHAMALRRDRNNSNPQQQQQHRRRLVFCQTCRTGWTLPARGALQPKRENDNNTTGPPVQCPICNFQVIQVRRGEGYDGNGYHVCPKCFSEPPIEHGGDPHGDQFRCFNCQHPTCRLATGFSASDNNSNNVEVFACRFCAAGRVRLKKNSRGYVLGCDQYSSNSDRRCGYTIWLPRGCQSAAVAGAGGDGGNENESDDDICAACSAGNRGVVRRVTMAFRPGSVPPHIGREVTACLLCDAELRRELQISLPQRDQVRTNAPPRRQQPQGGRGGRGGGGGGGGGGGNGWQQPPQQQQQQQQQQQPNRGGGGGGRGRGGGGGVRHSSQDYNTNGGGGGGANGVCFRCNQPGHYANACPNNNAAAAGNNYNNSNNNAGRGGAGGTGAGGAVCYRCHQPGHFANACPNNNAGNNFTAAGGGGGNNVCYRCHQPGHFANACPNNGG